jgi:hypothetical protein
MPAPNGKSREMQALYTDDEGDLDAFERVREVRNM